MSLPAGRRPSPQPVPTSPTIDNRDACAHPQSPSLRCRQPQPCRPAPCPALESGSPGRCRGGSPKACRENKSKLGHFQTSQGVMAAVKTVSSETSGFKLETVPTFQPTEPCLGVQVTLSHFKNIIYVARPSCSSVRFACVFSCVRSLRYHPEVWPRFLPNRKSQVSKETTSPNRKGF